MKRFRKIYVEITNVCNLSCSFCHGTKRAQKFMSPDEFRIISDKIAPYTDFIYLHLMGEPLLHPQLEDILAIAAENKLKVCLTSNGSLIKSDGEKLKKHFSGIHKISLSLQAMESNPGMDANQYLDDCFKFGKENEGKTIIVYRLWNEGGENKSNPFILEKMHRYFPEEWKKHPLGKLIGNRIYLENGDKFDWPDYEAAPTEDEDGRYYCYALYDQLGILSDGTVVPCCLDSEGSLELGNIFTQDLDEILKSERAAGISEGFKNGKAYEELCRRCGYAARFIKK